MQKVFFATQIDRLRNVYSEASLSDERVQILWDRFKLVNGEQFEKALNYLIGEFTTQALPSLSKISEAVAMSRSSQAGTAAMMQEILPAHFCEPCRDFGFGFVGDTVVACTCDNGRRISPDKLAHHQRSYDRGAKLFKKPISSMLPPLPYDPNERIG